MTRPEKIAALAELGYPVTRWGELGVAMERPPFYLRWIKVGPFLKRLKTARRQVRAASRAPIRATRPQSQRRQDYLQETGRRERA